MLFRYNIPGTTALVALLCLLVPPPSSASFNEGFQGFLNQQYGSTVAKQLIRSDLGVNGSFGGNIVNGAIRTFREPVILVHGLNSNASTLLSIRDFFNRQGFGIGEVYATSYGPQNGTTIDGRSGILCSYAKQLRQLITAVSTYTGGKRVNVIGYSLGAAIARKAILGGQCVDTKENLGQPLTDKVTTFLSVAGSNLGAVECNNFPNTAICSSTNGLKTNSAFLKDINSKKGYEGRARYSIGSRTDDIVGFANLTLPVSQINVTFTNFNHGDTLFNTLYTQASLISNGFVAQRTIDKDAYAESQLTGKNCSGSVSGSDSFEFGPHPSQQAAQGKSDGNNEFPGEYNRQSKVYLFLNGFNYTQHLDPKKGNFFNIKNQPYRRS